MGNLPKAIPEPPEGDMGWLWWHPDVEPNLEMGCRLWHCWNCDVTWKKVYHPSSKERIRCWCCGQFQKLPKI